MQSPDAQKAKKSLRKTLSVARAEMVPGPELASMFASQLSQLAKKLGVATVAGYLPFGNEPDLSGFLSQALEAKLRIVMPVSEPDGTLRWVEYTGDSAIGIFGFAEPVGKPADISDAQLILIPATAADFEGNRLGKGKGYYDRALAELEHDIPIAALVYESELLESIPTESHDRKVDFVITPERTIQINANLMG